MSSLSEVLYRPLDKTSKSERGFVFKPWIRSMATIPAPLIREHYVEAAKSTVRELFQRSTIIVAEDAAHPGDLFGVVSFEPGKALHLLYVKELLRGHGIGTDLLALATQHLPDPFHYTIKTRAVRKFLAGGKYQPKLVNPEQPTK